MKMETLKKLWKNEYFQTAVTIAIIITIVLGFWFGSQQALNTQYPALAVASGSMMPTLDIGDLIIVQGVPPEQIHASYLNGDIIIFRNPNNLDDLIVHRAVRKENGTDGYSFKTHGDNNGVGSEEGPFGQDYVVGKVVAKIPYVGNFALFMHTRENFYVFIIMLVILFVAFSIFPFGDREKKETQGKRRLFGKIDLDHLYIVVLNVLLIGFIVFNVWGAYTFWQPGSKGPTYVTARGVYPDVGYYQGFRYNHNTVLETFLSVGFLTYTVDCNATDSVHSGIRPGVLTLSIAQVAAIVLIVLDVWTMVRLLRARKTETLYAETSQP
jgi:signal peptidase